MANSISDHNEELNSLLPEYVNGRLSPEQRQRVDAWLDSNPRSRELLQSWQRLHAGLQGRTLRTPPGDVWLAIERQVSHPEQQVKRSVAGLLAGFSLAVITLVLLWWTVRPGVLLEWTVSGDSLAGYRVYRAVEHSQEFVLLGEVEGKPGEVQYSYLDVFFLPGRNYIYQVEGVTPSGVSIVSQRIAAQPLAALPGQLAILISSLLLGVLTAVLVRNWGVHSPPRLLPT